MIKIYNRNEISIDEILERSEQTIDVEGVVSDIIKNVKKYALMFVFLVLIILFSFYKIYDPHASFRAFHK